MADTRQPPVRNAKRCANTICGRPAGPYGMWCCIACIPRYEGRNHNTDCFLRMLEDQERGK